MREASRVLVWLGLLGCAGCRDAQPPAGAPTAPAPVAPSTAEPVAPASGPSAPSAPPASSASSASTSPFPPGSSAHGFDGDAVDVPPRGMSFGTTGRARAGRWIVRAEKDAPSPPNALVQVDTDDTDARFPVAVLDAPALRDARVSVRCKPISGKVDQACGLVVRYQDSDNYVVTRANALEGNVRLYVVKAGVRKQLASWSGAVTSGAWHTSRIEARGSHFTVWWDGARVLDHDDATFGGAGKAGVWTKADSVTAFDDLTVEAL